MQLVSLVHKVVLELQGIKAEQEVLGEPLVALVALVVHLVSEVKLTQEVLLVLRASRQVLFITWVIMQRQEQ
jgi:hypothetical protein